MRHVFDIGLVITSGEIPFKPASRPGIIGFGGRQNDHVSPGRIGSEWSLSDARVLNPWMRPHDPNALV
jgi:hypothetical protein